MQMEGTLILIIWGFVLQKITKKDQIPWLPTLCKKPP